MSVYIDRRDQGKVARDPALDKLEQIVRARMATEFVLFELASRVAPNILVTLPEEQRAKVAEYVRRFVLVPTNPPTTK